MGRLPKKWANYRRRYHWLRRTINVPAGPFYINVEPTNACNLKCRACSRDGSRKQGFMDLDLFRRIIDQAPGSGVREVALFLAGEPLLHRDLPYMVEYVHLKGLESWLVTNGCLLTEDKSRALLDAGIDNIWISFDGDNRKDYEDMRAGASYDQVLANVISFLKLKQQRASGKPYICIQMLKMKENPHQEIDPSFAALFKGLPLDDIFARNPHDWRGEKGEINMAPHGPNYFPCQVFWSAMSIAWDGRVVGCSADLNGTHILGDMRRQTILEVWNGAEMTNCRRLLKSKNYQQLDLCAGCHNLWYQGNPRLHILSQLPVFEQIKPAVKRLRILKKTTKKFERKSLV